MSGQIRFADISLSSAKQRAKISDMLIFVDTYAEWCHPCKEFDLIFTKRDLAQYFNRNFINVKVDMEGEFAREVRDKYQVAFLPTILFLNKDGKVIFKIDKLIDEVELMRLARLSVEGGIPVTTPPPPPVYVKKDPIAKPANVDRVNTTSLTSDKTTVQKEKKEEPRDVKEEAIAKEEIITDKEKRTEEDLPTAEVPKEKKIDGPSMQAPEPNKEDIVAEPNEKILYVLDANSGNIPPEILYEEAYFRMQFNDGSHLIAGKKYLNTQTNWSTEKNMKFIFDFMYDTETSEFDFFVANRAKYNEMLGKEVVDQTMEILIYNRLHNGYPRPNLEESIELFMLMNPGDGKQQAYDYFLPRLNKSSKFEKYTSLASEYIYDFNYFNSAIYLNYVHYTLAKDSSKKTVKECARLFSLIEEKDSQGYLYYMVEANLHYLKGKKGSALKAATKAQILADNKFSVRKQIDILIEKIESL